MGVILPDRFSGPGHLRGARAVPGRRIRHLRRTWAAEFGLGDMVAGYPEDWRETLKLYRYCVLERRAP